MKINPTIIILITGTLLANIVYFKVDTQSTQMVIIVLDPVSIYNDGLARGLA